VLVDDVHEAIKSMIMDGEIPPGARVSIDGLARQLSVSPTPVREALARLESAELVVKEPLRGYRTTSSGCSSSPGRPRGPQSVRGPTGVPRSPPSWPGQPPPRTTHTPRTRPSAPMTRASTC
jgi:DNA-binding transcriptional MocR family regulator